MYTFNRKGAFSPILSSSALLFLRDELHRVAKSALIYLKSIKNVLSTAECKRTLDEQKMPYIPIFFSKKRPRSTWNEALQLLSKYLLFKQRHPTRRYLHAIGTSCFNAVDIGARCKFTGIDADRSASTGRKTLIRYFQHITPQ